MDRRRKKRPATFPVMSDNYVFLMYDSYKAKS